MIGSHICMELMASGYQVTVIDNLGNSKEEALHRVSEITGRAPGFVRADLRDRGALFRERDFDAVIHCAEFKAVGESTRIPLDYYENVTIQVQDICAGSLQPQDIVFSSARNAQKQGIFQLTSHPENRKPLFLYE